jgi:hypothetical protein
VIILCMVSHDGFLQPVIMTIIRLFIKRARLVIRRMRLYTDQIKVDKIR